MSFNAKDMTQGGQIASMRIRMFSQIANIMLYCLFIFFWILVGRKRKPTAVCSH
ncbi:conjugal transfer protein TraD [Escherichia coli]|nr:conjugal transfer protein TraD [Escherichia coli]